MSHFTPAPALVGGALIGLAAAMLLVLRGQIAGISGIVAGAFQRDGAWRAAFLAGMVAAGVAAALLLPARFGAPAVGTGVVLVGGVLAGLGARISGGCTSGHGVCGLGRLSRRSLVAVVTFMAVGVGTATLVRLVGGGA
jgi:uncharacterized membrane protein YedE/YeeE